MPSEMLKDSLRFLKINAFLYKNTLEGLSEEELHRLPSDHSNPMIWIAGHVLNSRVSLARYAGDCGSLSLERSVQAPEPGPGRLCLPCPGRDSGVLGYD